MQTTIINKNDDIQVANDVFALCQFLKAMKEHSNIVILYKSGTQLPVQINKAMSDFDHGVLFCHGEVQRPSQELQQMVVKKTTSIVLLSQVASISQIINETPNSLQLIEGKN